MSACCSCSNYNSFVTGILLISMTLKKLWTLSKGGTLVIWQMRPYGRLGGIGQITGMERQLKQCGCSIRGLADHCHCGKMDINQLHFHSCTFSYLVLMSQPLDALFSTYLPPHHCIFGYLFMKFLLLLCYFVFVILPCIIQQFITFPVLWLKAIYKSHKMK